MTSITAHVGHWLHCLWLLMEDAVCAAKFKRKCCHAEHTQFANNSAATRTTTDPTYCQHLLKIIANEKNLDKKSVQSHIYSAQAPQAQSKM